MRCVAILKVRLQALFHVGWVVAELMLHFKDYFLEDRLVVDSYSDAFRDRVLSLVQIKPLVLLDLFEAESQVWVWD